MFRFFAESANAAMRTLTLAPTPALTGTVTLPGSKSISNRALLLAAMAEGETQIRNLLDSDDTRYMVRALEALGIPMEQSGTECLVRGVGGPLATRDIQLDLDLGL